MVYKYAGGIAFILLSLPLLGLNGVPPVLTGLACVIAGVALLMGV